MIDPQLQQHLCGVLGVPEVTGLETIQTLWSGCGQVARVILDDASPVVIKHVKMPERLRHPRGWDTDRSAQRKVRSYEVETNWYAQRAGRCSAGCRVPRYLGHTSRGDERLLILEDIDASGFDRRLTRVSPEQLDACIRWLASFHATFLGEPPDGLWETGTYWHLGTRPDEYDALPDGPLKHSAQQIDHALDASPYRTLVHGDAKPANFCFSADNRVAAVDFQYVGGGCGMKDLAYLVGGCLDSDACFESEAHVLATYFAALKQALHKRGSAADTKQLESDWRRLYPCAWADFERFLQGWSPGHWKISTYSRHMTEQALESLR
ncbi:MAG: phosphotransferase [Planctomycetota bacterium]